eukprot:GILJ01020575.1.p1 GENE.GILJ01020575.1~~GILJ01020575.1.p1  ORF type:complete len:577 (-),score=64.39 GILJ01020575.1:132-1862(-)
MESGRQQRAPQISNKKPEVFSTTRQYQLELIRSAAQRAEHLRKRKEESTQKSIEASRAAAKGTDPSSRHPLSPRAVALKQVHEHRRNQAGRSLKQPFHIVSQFYHLLYRGAREKMKDTGARSFETIFGFVVPQTILFVNSRPVEWFLTSLTDGRFIKKKASVDEKAILRSFAKQHRASATDVVACWYPDARMMDASYINLGEDSSPGVSCPEFFDVSGLRQFLLETHDKGDGILQQFTIPKTSNNMLIRTSWRDDTSHIVSRTNKFKLNDRRVDIFDRMATFEGWGGFSTKTELPDGVFKQRLEEIVGSLAFCLKKQNVKTHELSLLEAVELFYKVDDADRLTFICCSGLSYKDGTRCGRMVQSMTHVNSPMLSRSSSKPPVARSQFHPPPRNDLIEEAMEATLDVGNERNPFLPDICSPKQNHSHPHGHPQHQHSMHLSSTSKSGQSRTESSLSHHQLSASKSFMEGDSRVQDTVWQMHRDLFVTPLLNSFPMMPASLAKALVRYDHHLTRQYFTMHKLRSNLFERGLCEDEDDLHLCTHDSPEKRSSVRRTVTLSPLTVKQDIYTLLASDKPEL